jgi:hypothetical protein
MPNLKSFYLLRKSTFSGFTKCINTFMVTAMLFFGSKTYAGSFTASGTTLTLDLDVASQLVTVVSTGTTYTFTLSGGATNTWTGTTSSSVSVSGVVLTVTATGLSTFGTINITDSQTGNAVTFNNSGANAYSDNINITLNNSPGAVTFNGASSFSGNNAINVTTSMYITFAVASGLSTVNGNLTLDANTQATPNNFAFSGIAVNAATVQVTGTGVMSMRARGGSTGSSTLFLNKGIVVYAGGQVKGGTTGTATFEGWGYTGLSGTTGAQGVVVNGTGPLGTSTISSNGANVSVTGYGSNTTAAAVLNQLNVGVVVGTMTINMAATDVGIISSGGTGAVVVTGYGGTCANPASALVSASYGVYVASTSTSASITSGRDLTVTGIGGGPDSLGGNNHGVYVNYSAIISGTDGNLVVTGTGGNSKSASSGNHGVSVTGGPGVTKGQIKAGAGTGTTLVTGTGGGLKATGSNYGINLSNSGIISSLGSGSVTVIGYGGNLNGTGSSNNGVNIWEVSSIITSNGGNVRVEGTGGGGPTTVSNYGIQLHKGAVLSAGGSGTVTAIGRGGNVNGISGYSNIGVYVTTTIVVGGFAVPYITSSGGNVTVTGTGGGGSSGSASASSSGSNHGVYTELGGYITAGGTGNVLVTGTGGNSSTGATGVSNLGVFVDAFALKGTTELYSTAITSGGGNITINGTGGGKGSSGNNSGVYNKGLIKATGAGTVSITGTGGNTSGGSNVGVNLDGAVTVLTVLYPATVSSDGGNVTVTGTGGTVASGSSLGSAHGVLVSGSTATGRGGSIITAGGSGNVTVTGYGGQNLATSGNTNYGVFVVNGKSPNFSTITSSGGNVTVAGTGGGGSGASASTSANNTGVYVNSSGIITAGGNGTVTVTGNGGNNSTSGTGVFNCGVDISNGTSPNFSKISSNNGAVTVTGNGGGSGGSAAANNGVYVMSGGQITSVGAATAVTVNGTGGAGSGSINHGISVEFNSIITSGGGNVAINGTEGSSATSLALLLTSAGAISTATNGGNITITGNSFGSVAGTSIAAKADGIVNIFPKTSSTTVGFVSTADTKGSIYISTAELATITGGTINIGNSSTGAISISQAVTVPTGSNLNLATASSSGGLNPKLTGTEITMAAGKTLGLTGISSLNIAITGATVNTQYDQFKVVGNVTLTGMTLTLSGAFTPTGGEVFTIVDATSVTGTFTGLANGATVSFNGVNLIINYTSTTVTLTAPCTNPTAGGTIAAAQSGTNPFTPAAFTSTVAASGQFGIVEYKWQSSTTSNSAGFADIASSNAATYTAGALTVTTWFKRLARVSCKSDWTGAVVSNVIEVTVTNCTNPTSGGTIAAAQNGTTPFNPAAFTSTVAASGQSGTVEYKWQSSITNATTGFSDIASSNADTYDEGALTVTTWYKRLARVSCSADWTGAVESNVIEVTVVSLLPVTGIELGGTATDKQVKLSFKALNEREMSNYTIERSANGTSFTNLGSLQASNAAQTYAIYSFIDNQPIVGNNYYRIKGNSINGQIQYSNVVAMKFGINAASVSLFPNPITSSSFMLKLQGMEAGEYGIQLFTNQGKQVMVKEIKHFGGSSTLKMHLPSGLSAGIYFIRYTKNNVVFKNEQVIIE